MAFQPEIYGCQEEPFEATRFWFWQHKSYPLSDGYVINMDSVQNWWSPLDWWDALSSLIAPTAVRAVAPAPEYNWLPSKQTRARVPGEHDIIELMPRRTEVLMVPRWKVRQYEDAGYTINTHGNPLNPFDWPLLIASNLFPTVVKSYPWTPDQEDRLDSTPA